MGVFLKMLIEDLFMQNSTTDATVDANIKTEMAMGNASPREERWCGGNKRFLALCATVLVPAFAGG